MTNTRELLAEHAAILNRYGAQSKEAQQFLADHRFNDEFYELALISKRLKEVLTAPQHDHVCN